MILEALLVFKYNEGRRFANFLEISFKTFILIGGNMSNVKFGGISIPKVKVRIRIKDCEESRNHPDFGKFAGRVVIAVAIPGRVGKCFEFSANFSSGFRGLVQEKHTISENLVEILMPPEAISLT